MEAYDENDDVEKLLSDLRKGSDVDVGLMRRVYQALYDVAREQRAVWQGNATLNATALVHEAYLKLVSTQTSFESREHFLAYAARAMRHLLVNYARRQAAQKRGGGAADVTLDTQALLPPGYADKMDALGDALDRLETVDPRAARVVECRFFGGYSMEETAAVLGVSRRTAHRDWVSARAWLYSDLNST